MNKKDVVIVGGSAAGLTAGITVRRHYPNKTILLVRSEEQVLIPCGIPYIYGTVGSPEKNLIPDTLLEKNKIDLLIANATNIDTNAKVLKTDKGDVNYDRMILATGSIPSVRPMPGFDMNGVYPIIKTVPHLTDLQKQLKSANDVVVIGGGFIGIEFADEIKKSGVKNVTIIEIMSHCLNLAYDTEFCIDMEKHIAARNINIITNVKVACVKGNGKVEAVELENGREIPANVVILGTGAMPNVKLAESAGLSLAPDGSIAVDRMMKTSNSSIFACGDCAQKVSFFGGVPSTLKLASIATFEARIAGANLFAIKRENIGTVGVWSTAVGNLAVGTAGLTETMATKNGYDIISVSVEGPNRHPGGMPGSTMTRMKLVFEKSSGILLGGQVIGDSSVGELINALSACIQKRMVAEDLAMFQTGTHPALTASPIVYPIVTAAEMAIAKMSKT
ncbi:MAG: FAD-dependent oxidoreductase [Lentisphaerae bacterium]|nr:FAD-dependent oxidoreductase [Lentisphaerota bacterium]